MNELYEGPTIVKFIETESRKVVTMICRGRCLMVTEFQIYKTKKFWRSVSQQYEYT